jgi:hypothetical protein
VNAIVRERWESFAGRTGLRLLPPVPTVLLVVTAGVLVPFLAAVDALPTQFDPDLARDRVARFRAQYPKMPDSGPSGLICSRRPAFFWPEHAGADSYSLRVYSNDGTEQVTADGLRTTFHLIEPPGGLVPGVAYRFEVAAVVAGHTIPWQEHDFTVRPPPDDLEPLLEGLRMRVGPEESAFVVLGYYASLPSPSPCDVVSAFLHWKALRGELASLPPGAPATWLDTLVAR